MTLHLRRVDELSVNWRPLTTTELLTRLRVLCERSGEDEESARSASDVLMTLALHHGERALPLLSEMALGNERWRWLRAGFALSKLGAPAVSVLLEIVRDPRPERRHTAIDWLKMVYPRSHDPRIVDFLFEIIQENDSSTRVAEGMRYHATLALGECGDPRAVGPLLEILQNAAIPRMMKDSTVHPLGELGDERVLEALMAAYEASKAEEDETDVGEHHGRRYEFQDALLRAMEKIHARLDTAEADAD